MKSRNTKLVSLFLIVALLLAFLPSASAANVELTAEQDAKAIIPVTDSFLTDSGCQIGRYIDTLAFKEKNHVSRLKADEDVNTYVFLNEDNTRTVYYMDEAVKFVDDDGYIREKNTDLTYHVTGFSTAQNDVGLEIPTLPSSGISLSLDENQITLYPLNGYPLSAAIRNGNSVDYPYFYGLGTTLRYTPTLSGIKEDIILSSYNGVHEFSFRITTSGLNLYQVNNRYYLAETEDADTKFWLGCVEIFDANARPGYGTMTAETVVAGQEYILTLSADPAFLTDPNTVYPVTIDPTLQVKISDNLTGVNTIIDAPIYEGFPDTNFGTYQYNRVGYLDSSYKIGRTVVKFPSLLTNSKYVSAPEIINVKFHIADASGYGATTIRLHPLTSNESWTENNITWKNIGSYSQSAYTSTSTLTNSYYTFNITNLVKDWEKNDHKPDCGFVLISSNETNASKALYSAEHSTSSMRPYITFDYKTYVNLGAALPYDEEGWNETLVAVDTYVYEITNCYSYALNYKDSPLFVGNSVPGFSCVYEAFTLEVLSDHLKNDAQNWRFTLVEMPDRFAEIPDNAYRIAFAACYQYGFHFFRQNSDGTWSHKRGTNPITKNDASGKTIYDPIRSNRFYSVGDNYTNDAEIAFYYITLPTNLP